MSFYENSCILIYDAVSFGVMLLTWWSRLLCPSSRSKESEKPASPCTWGSKLLRNICN